MDRQYSDSPLDLSDMSLVVLDIYLYSTALLAGCTGYLIDWGYSQLLE
jgi:hypothetical protein